MIESEYPIPPNNPQMDSAGGVVAFVLFISFILLVVAVAADKEHQKEQHQALEEVIYE